MFSGFEYGTGRPFSFFGSSPSNPIVQWIFKWGTAALFLKNSALIDHASRARTFFPGAADAAAAAGVS